MCATAGLGRVSSDRVYNPTSLRAGPVDAGDGHSEIATELREDSRAEMGGAAAAGPFFALPVGFFVGDWVGCLWVEALAERVYHRALSVVRREARQRPGV
jgi:hypothetical protein